MAEPTAGKFQGKEQPTMVHVLLLRQVGFFKVVTRQTHGRLHQRSSGILIVVGNIRLSLSLIGMTFGRLRVNVGRYGRRDGIGMV